MSAELREQLYANLNLKETDDLLEIWATNDRTEWSDDAFDVIKQILVNRSVDLPLQDDPIYEHDELQKSGHDRDGLEEWEIKLLDREDQPDFYDTLEVLDLRKKLDWTFKAAVVVFGLLGILQLPGMLNLLAGNIPSLQKLTNSILPAFVSILLYGTTTLVIVFLLKAFGSILRILMEMEFNSRAAK
jgi:hypothetical protein